MRNIIIIINTILYRCWAFFFVRKLSISNAKFLFTRIKGCAHNKIALSNGHFCYNTITIEGENNVLDLSASIYKTKIKIFGSNNKLIIHAKYINFTELIIRGDNCTIEIGEGTTIGSGMIVCMGNHTSITIGNNAMLADNIDIWNSDTHPIFDDNNNLINPSSSISIGDYVWLGKGVRVLKGVTIGDGAVVGMNSLVTKDVESNSMNAGMPSRQIKRGIHWKREFISNFE